MELSRVTMVPFIEKMRPTVPDNLQRWYADDVAAVGNRLDNAENNDEIV